MFIALVSISRETLFCDLQLLAIELEIRHDCGNRNDRTYITIYIFIQYASCSSSIEKRTLTVWCDPRGTYCELHAWQGFIWLPMTLNYCYFGDDVIQYGRQWFTCAIYRCSLSGNNNDCWHATFITIPSVWHISCGLSSLISIVCVIGAKFSYLQNWVWFPKLFLYYLVVLFWACQILANYIRCIAPNNSTI